MVDILVFSKDRAFQLHLFLDTLFSKVSNIGNVFVQFGYSNELFLNGYKKISNEWPDQKIHFIDEQKYGFLNTLRSIAGSELKSDYLMIETDDSLFINDLDLKSCYKILEDNSDVGRYNYQMNWKLFTGLSGKLDYFKIDKANHKSDDVQDVCLGYSFNVGGAISKTADLVELLKTYDISHPIDLEIKGNEFTNYKSYHFNILNGKECSTMMHLNNLLGRYEETYSTKKLNDILISGEVIDIENIDFLSLKRDLSWFNGLDIGRFPIFPWEIAPVEHDKVLSIRRRL